MRLMSVITPIIRGFFVFALKTPPKLLSDLRRRLCVVDDSLPNVPLIGLLVLGLVLVLLCIT